MRPLASMVLKSTRRIFLSLLAYCSFERLWAAGRRRPRGRRSCPAGGEVLLHQHRRDRQHVADVVEAVAEIVGGKVLLGAEFDAQQIADGVGVFGAIQAAGRDAAGVGLECCGRPFRTRPAGTGSPLQLRRAAACPLAAFRPARILRRMMSHPSRLLVSEAAWVNWAIFIPPDARLSLWQGAQALSEYGGDGLFKGGISAAGRTAQTDRNRVTARGPQPIL